MRMPIPRLALLAMSLPPRQGHGGRPAVQVAPGVFGAVFEPAYQANELLDGLFIGLAALFGRGQLGIAQNAGFGIAAGPGDERRGSRSKEINPVEGAVLFVEADGTASDLIFADVVAIQVQVKRRLELAGVGAAAGKLALPPAGQEFL